MGTALLTLFIALLCYVFVIIIKIFLTCVKDLWKFAGSRIPKCVLYTAFTQEDAYNVPCLAQFKIPSAFMNISFWMLLFVFPLAVQLLWNIVQIFPSLLTLSDYDVNPLRLWGGGGSKLLSCKTLYTGLPLMGSNSNLAYFLNLKIQGQNCLYFVWID